MKSMPSSLRCHAANALTAITAIAAAVTISACGGGGGASAPEPGTPFISAFTSASANVFIGESTTLTGQFSGGTGVVTPGIGPVQNNTAVSTGPLDRPTTYTLAVEAPGKATVSQTVTVDARFRDRYANATTFRGSQHTASLMIDGTVLLIGGSRGEGVVSDAIDRYNPATGTITRVGNLSAGRVSHRATRVQGGGILVTGGLTSTGDSRAAQFIDETTGQASAAGFMSTPRLDQAVVTLRDGRVLVTGGNTSMERLQLGISDTAELWDPATRTFRKLTTRLRQPRSSHSMTVLRDGRVLIVGGFTSKATYEMAEIFDPATETFTAVTSPNEVRANHAAHMDANGRVLVIGGESVGVDGVSVIPLKTVYRFDPVTNAFTAMPSLSVARTFFDSVMLPSGDVYMFGGQSVMPDYTATAERYNATTGGVPIAAMSVKRALHTVTRLATGRLFIAGGEQPGGAYTTNALAYE